MKKLSLAVVAIVFISAITACGGGSASGPSGDSIILGLWNYSNSLSASIVPETVYFNQDGTIELHGWAARDAMPGANQDTDEAKPRSIIDSYSWTYKNNILSVNTGHANIYSGQVTSGVGAYALRHSCKCGDYGEITISRSNL
jgi:hypothetical protein